MIIHAEIISQPFSGEYEEKVYDIESPWNSQNWTYIKFTNNNAYQWVGSFRGEAKGTYLSNRHHIILVFTSDYLFQLNILSGEIMKYDEHGDYYQYLTISPLNNFIICDYSSIYKIEDNIDKKIKLEIPISISLVDYVKLKEWKGNKLQFTCEEPTAVDCYLCDMEYDCITDAITLIKKSIL